jgi:hypothetical protein
MYVSGESRPLPFPDSILMDASLPEPEKERQHKAWFKVTMVLLRERDLAR